jgi:hypothetical protein
VLPIALPNVLAFWCAHRCENVGPQTAKCTCCPGNASIAIQIRVQPLAQACACLLEKKVQLRVGVWVLGDLEERVENVVDHLLEVLHNALLPIHVVQPRDLHNDVTRLRFRLCFLPTSGHPTLHTSVKDQRSSFDSSLINTSLHRQPHADHPAVISITTWQQSLTDNRHRPAQPPSLHLSRPQSPKTA